MAQQRLSFAHAFFSAGGRGRGFRHPILLVCTFVFLASRLQATMSSFRVSAPSHMQSLLHWTLRLLPEASHAERVRQYGGLGDMIVPSTASPVSCPQNHNNMCIELACAGPRSSVCMGNPFNDHFWKPWRVSDCCV